MRRSPMARRGWKERCAAMSMNLTPHSAPKMSRTARYKHTIANIRKNSCERLQVTLEEYNGCDLLNLSVVRDSTGRHRLNGMRGTARYVSLNTRLLPQLIAALQEAERKARELGVLETTDTNQNEEQ
jgi:hypothetical protein